MIFEFLMNLAGLFFDVILRLLSLFPDLPAPVVTTIDNGITTIFSYATFVSLFIDIDYFSKYLLPLAVVGYNAKRIYNLTMFVIRKIPFVSIH